MAGNVCREAELLKEPSLDELFAEPIVQLIMKRDGVEALDIRSRLSHLFGPFTPALVL